MLTKLQAMLARLKGNRAARIAATLAFIGLGYALGQMDAETARALLEGLFNAMETASEVAIDVSATAP